MTSKELLTLLNQAIADEIQVSIQYAVQSFVWKGIHGFAVKEELMNIAKNEMTHIEKVSERIWYLGEMPTTIPDLVTIGTTLKEMLELNIKDEVGAIELYKKIISQATLEQDTTTAFLASQILQEEEQHHDVFSTLLEEL